MLDVLVEQTVRAKILIDSKPAETLLSPKQIIVYGLFSEGGTLSVREIAQKLAGDVGEATIKKALGQLVALKLLERFGRARSTRYKKK